MMEDKPISIVEKVLADPGYIYSYEFAMKMANFKDNGDGTVTFTRPNPYLLDDERILT